MPEGLSTPCTWLSHNHVPRDVPTTWPRSVPRKVAPQLTTTVGWPPAGDRQGRVRAGLSLLLGRPAGPVAPTGWRPPGAPWSCDLNAAATSPGHLLRAGACAWWLSCCSALRVPACSPQDIPGVPFHSDVLLVHPRLQQEAMAALRASAARGHDFSSWDHDHRRV